MGEVVKFIAINLAMTDDSSNRARALLRYSRLKPVLNSEFLPCPPARCRLEYRFPRSRRSRTRAGGYIHNNCPNYFWGIAECNAGSAELYGIATGDSLSGFLATSTVGTIPDSIAFMAYTWDGSATEEGPVTYATRVNASVPEPGSMMLLATGMLGLVGIRRRRRSQK